MSDISKARALFAAGDLAGAQEECERLRTADGPSAEILSLFGMIAAKRGELDGARSFLEQACGLAPDLAQPWHNLAVVHRMQRRLDAAAAAAAAAVERDPGSARPRITLAKILLDSGRLEDAAAMLSEAAGLPDAPEAELPALAEQIGAAVRAADEALAGRPASAIGTFERAERAAHDALARDEADEAHALMSSAVAGYRAALQLNPEDFLLRRRFVLAQHIFISKFQLKSRKKEQLARSFFRELEDMIAEGRRYLGRHPADLNVAMVVATALTNVGRADEGAQAVRDYLAVDPENPVARSKLRDLLLANDTAPDDKAERAEEPRTSRPAGSRLPVHRWPRSCQSFDDIGGIITGSIADAAHFPRIIGPTTRITTMGSCFAHNLAAALVRQGIDATAFPFGEEINSTYANRLIFQLAEEGAEGFDFSGHMFGADDIARLAGRIAETDVFVLTLGVSEGFFDAQDRFRLLSRDLFFARKSSLAALTFRRITLEENVANIRSIIDTVRRLRPGIRVVLTVSPVPLSATFGDKPVFQADCLSKSTLRLAADAVVGTGGEGVHYWPSFEAVRWLGAHLEVPQGLVYGADDGQSRSVSRFIVDAIMTCFLEVAGTAE